MLQEKVAEWRQKAGKVYLPEELDAREPLVREILELKEQKNAVILGHNYMTPDVYYGISDFVGDSLELSRRARETDADIILFNGVHFMAETAKILNPQRKVLIADPKAGCSLAESMTAEDVRRLRRQHPGVPIVSYINCSAEVKAEVDIICTSANAVKIVESLPGDTVIVVPDGYLAHNIQKQTKKTIIPWAGKCIVHELYTEADVEYARRSFPAAKIIAHPECKETVTAKVDFVGSTSQMGRFIQESGAKEVLLLTECSMSDNLRSQFPEVTFISSCQTCPHMKKITLEKVRDALRYEQHEVTLPQDVISRAQRSLERMLQVA
ncbi:MAG: quinolinate synthase NadA [Turneriella sp.]|nr:quinolinate synthase NadA [Turneriella sp.]